MVVSVHDLNLAHRYCDELLLLYEGEILAQGNTGSVLTPRLIEKAFHVCAQILPVNGEEERYFIMRTLEERE